MECISISPVIAICVLVFIASSPIAAIETGYWPSKKDRRDLKEWLRSYHSSMRKKDFTAYVLIASYPAAFPVLATFAYPARSALASITVAIIAMSIKRATCLDFQHNRHTWYRPES